MTRHDEAVERAIRTLGQRRFFLTEGRRLELRSLVPAAEWRPLDAPWWTGKQVCVMGEDTLGNPVLRHCDGTVRLWDPDRRTDVVLAPSVAAFLAQLGP